MRPRADAEIVAALPVVDVVPRMKTDGHVQVFFEVLQSLTRVGINQVETEVFESGISDDSQCFDSLTGGVNPAKKLEHMRLERLDSDADPIHTGRAVTRKILAIHGSRVRFQGDFAIGIDRKQSICALENAADARRMKSRRGAPA